MNESIEDRLRRWATTAYEPLPFITGGVTVNVLPVDAPRPEDLRRLADLVAAVREALDWKRGWDPIGGRAHRQLDGPLQEVWDRLAALDEASESGEVGRG